MTNEEKIIDKVRKLLALATSSNEHEAAAAAAKAQELLLKYNLSESQVTIGDLEEKAEHSEFYEKYKSGWMGQLMYGICQSLCCEMVSSTQYKGKTFHIFGKPSNIEVATYLYEYLRREVIKIQPHYNKLAFSMGAVVTINKKLRQTFTEFQKASDQTMALVHVQNQAAIALRNEVFPKLSKGRSASLDSYAFSEGRRAGEGIAIHRGVGNTNTGGQFLLN